jgi:hypothetical protein
MSDGWVEVGMWCVERGGLSGKKDQFTFKVQTSQREGFKKMATNDEIENLKKQ